jgi:hypothetical protein
MRKTDAGAAIRARAALGLALSTGVQMSARAHQIPQERRQAELEALKARTLSMTSADKSPERAPLTGRYRVPADLATKLIERGIDPRPIIAGKTPEAARASLEAAYLAAVDPLAAKLHDVGVDISRFDGMSGPARQSSMELALMNAQQAAQSEPTE